MLEGLSYTTVTVIAKNDIITKQMTRKYNIKKSGSIAFRFFTLRFSAIAPDRGLFSFGYRSVQRVRCGRRIV